MNKLIKSALITTSLLIGSSATANNMYLDLGNNSHDAARFLGASDANTSTAVFSEFGMSQLLATSIYDMTDASIFGSFYDTNINSELTAAGVPSSGIALDGVTTVNLALPIASGAQSDIDALSPLAPPLASDSEGFLQTWDLQIEYHFDGILSATGPTYTGGFFNVFFNDFNDASNNRQVLGGTLTGSVLSAANLDVFFDITMAEDNFLWIENNGVYVDANDGVVSGNFAKLALDTNVNPPIPTTDQLLLVGTNAIRQATLDSSVTASIPEPASLALLGLGLLGFGAVRRRQG